MGRSLLKPLLDMVTFPRPALKACHVFHFYLQFAQFVISKFSWRTRRVGKWKFSCTTSLRSVSDRAFLPSITLYLFSFPKTWQGIPCFFHCPKISLPLSSCHLGIEFDKTGCFLKYYIPLFLSVPVPSLLDGYVWIFENPFPVLEPFFIFSQIHETVLVAVPAHAVVFLVIVHPL